MTSTVKWLLSLVASVLIFGISLFLTTAVSRFESLDRRLDALEIAVSSLKDKMHTLDDLAAVVHKAQIDQATAQVPSRIALLTDSLAALTRRVDQLTAER